MWKYCQTPQCYTFVVHNRVFVCFSSLLPDANASIIMSVSFYLFARLVQYYNAAVGQENKSPNKKRKQYRMLHESLLLKAKKYTH